MAKHKGPARKACNPRKIKTAPWEPTVRHMEWFLKWTRQNKGPTQIASENGVKISRAAVCQAIHKVAEWIRMQSYEQIMALRTRQTQQLEMVMQDAWDKWQESYGQVIVTTTTDDGDNGIITQTKQSLSHGDVAYLDKYMAAQKSIRELWGVAATVKTEVELKNANEIEGLPGMNGFKSRAEFLLATAEALKARAMASV